MQGHPRLYPRGFLLTSSQRQLPPQVTEPRIFSVHGYSLHAEELTEVDLAERGRTWVAVLGKAWPLSTGPVPTDTASVAQALLDLATSDKWKALIDEALYDMGGRYAVLVHVDDSVTLYNDACGNRSVFYSTETGDVASHFALIRQGLSDKSLQRPTGNDHREDLSWDQTRNPHIRTLVPNHRVTLVRGEHREQERYFPLSANRAAAIGSEDRLAQIKTLWEEQLKFILKYDHPKAMSITAGLDSRTMLAMAQSERDEFSAFTYTTTEAIEGVRPTTHWSRSGQVDYQGVETLRPFLPRTFQYISIPADRDSDPGTKWVTEHRDILARNAERSHNRRLLPRYMELFPDPRTIHYRGNLFEIGRLHFRTLDGTRESAFDELVANLARGADLDVPTALSEARVGAKRMEYQHIPEDYDLTDIFYWEQRHGRWFAQVLNETDAVFDTVTPFNVRRIIDLFLSYSIEDRAEAFAQKELIYRSAPLLTFVGINGEPDLYRKHVSSGKPKHSGRGAGNIAPRAITIPPDQKSQVGATQRSASSVERKTADPEPKSTTWDKHYRAPIFRHPNLKSLGFSGTTTAIHQVDLGGTRRLDFYAKLERHDTLFVSLHGAVPQTAPRYPHFRRVESMKARVPALLCIADPTLALSNDDMFRLAWYVGDADWDPIQDIADLVRSAQRHVGATRVMFLGGSGGGFASLRLAPLFPGSMAFVQDPQTDVARYYPAHLDRLFGAVWPDWEQEKAFAQHPERFNLLHLYPQLDPDVFVYYRQSNGDQWHKTNHAEPFEAAVKATSGFASGKYTFVYEDSEKEGHGKITAAEFDWHFEAAMAFWDRASPGPSTR